MKRCRNSATSGSKAVNQLVEEREGQEQRFTFCVSPRTTRLKRCSELPPGTLDISFHLAFPLRCGEPAGAGVGYFWYRGRKRLWHLHIASASGETTPPQSVNSQWITSI